MCSRSSFAIAPDSFAHVIDALPRYLHNRYLGRLPPFVPDGTTCCAFGLPPKRWMLPDPRAVRACLGADGSFAKVGATLARHRSSGSGSLFSAFGGGGVGSSTDHSSRRVRNVRVDTSHDTPAKRSSGPFSLPIYLDMLPSVHQ